MLFSACNEKKTIADKEFLNVNKERVMRYVLCPEDTVDYLLQVADSIYSQREGYDSLEMLDFCYEHINEWFDSLTVTKPL